MGRVFRIPGGRRVPAPNVAAKPVRPASLTSRTPLTSRASLAPLASLAILAFPIPIGAGGLVPEAAAQALPSREWHLDRMRVPAVWRAFEERGRRPGEGVRVGVIDTGYTRHPELGVTDDDASPVDWRAGWDFVEDRPDPSDAVDPGFLRGPGHGTQLASLIVSPRGPADHDGSEMGPGVSGVAPGARVIPYRVSRSVVQVDFSRFDEALRRAADDGVDVVTICSGGLRSKAIEDAVDYARARGVIVVAAAGNEVRAVVWPAGYRPTVAVAATTYSDAPWWRSSRGSAVDFSAPGADIWTAFTHHVPGAPLFRYTVELGSGTSMATSVTSGVVALWVAWHGKDALVARYGLGGVATAFDRIVASGDATRTPPGWDGARYGKGILDAWKLLNAPLPPP